MRSSLINEAYLTPLLIGIGALILFSLNWPFNLSNGSFNLINGVSTVGAELVLNGNIPYRDFWTMYAPGHFYLGALLFGIFGSNLLVEVAAASVISAAAVYMCYWIAFNLSSNRKASIASAAIFFAAIYETNYFKRLGSYPTGILLVFIALNFVILYYKNANPKYLGFAGLAVGLSFVFKHDVGLYTVAAILTGLITQHVMSPWMAGKPSGSFTRKLLIFLGGFLLIALPIYFYFSLTAGPDMLQNLVVFPMTDFPFSRPEKYPGLFPTGIFGSSGIELFQNLFRYLNFTIPFILFLAGLLSLGISISKKHLLYFVTGVTFTIAFLLHFSAAHIQINTHIVTMSAYATWMGIMLYSQLSKDFKFSQTVTAKVLVSSIVIVWVFSLMGKPGYLTWRNLRSSTDELNLPKLSGFRVTSQESETYHALKKFVNVNVPEDQAIFVGLHRHDVIVIGDVMAYFLLDRPIASRYPELHPAITDTQPIQQEIIRDLQAKDVNFIILKNIFPDQYLNRVKMNFMNDLPNIGATDLDEFIKNNFIEVEAFGPYTIWERKSISSY